MVFGRFEADAPNERWVGDALHGPKVAGRKTYLFAFLDDHSRLAVGLPVRVRRGHRPAGRRAAARAGRPRCPRLGLCRQRLGVRRRVAAPGVRETRDPAGPSHPAPTPRTRQDRTILSHRERSVPRRGPRLHRRRDRRDGCRSPAAALLELNGLFTAWVETAYHHHVHSETGQTPLARWHGRLGPGRARPGDARRRCVDRGVPVVRVAHRDQDRDRVVARQHLPGRTRAGRPARSSWCSPRSTSKHIEVRYRDKSYGNAVAAHTSPGTPTPKPDPRHPNPSRRPATGIDYLAMVADTHHQQVARRRTHQLRRPLPPPPTTAQTPRATQHRRHPRRHRRRPRPTTGEAIGMSVQRLQAHYGIHPDAVRPEPGPGMLHRYTGHGEAVARISWCVDQHALGVITGEVGAGKTVAVRAATAALDTIPARGHLPAQPLRRGPRHAAPHRRRPRPGPQLLHRHPRPASRRRPGRRTRRTGPHPRRWSSTKPTCWTTSNSKRSGC